MRTMLRWTVPADQGNKAVNDGSMGSVIEAVMAKASPEAACFLAEGRDRSGIVVCDLREPADIPPIAEIPFNGLHARVESVPVMNGDDLEKTLASL
ncbi:MAG: hypothetical protein AB7R55_06390 [Gemmatimonadales bacterium]